MADEATSGTEPTADQRPTGMTHHWVGVGFAAFLVVLGAAYTIRASSFGMTAERTPIGPGAAPVILGILLVAGAAVILAVELRSLVSARRTHAAAGAASTSTDSGAQLLRAVGVLALLAVGLGLSRIVGMIAAMTIAVMGIAFLIERLPLTRVLVLGAVTALLLWLVFAQLLSVNFPPSLLGI